MNTLRGVMLGTVAAFLFTFATSGLSGRLGAVAKGVPYAVVTVFVAILVLDTINRDSSY